MTSIPNGAWTKGPWSFRYYMDPVGKRDDNFHLFEGPEGDEGGTILEGSFVIAGTHSDALKIARLIAAAPELYEAAALALEVLGDLAVRPDPSTSILNLYARCIEVEAALRTALAHARGES